MPIRNLIHILKLKWISILIYIENGKKKKVMKSCCFALTKPGTITLELALLGIPAIVIYKTSWITYLLGRPFVRVSHMALPNLLLEEPIYPEFIQGRCTFKNVFTQMQRLYTEYKTENEAYKKRLDELQKIRTMLKKPHSEKTLLHQ